PHLFASMDITGMHRMLARLTAITVPTGSMAAFFLGAGPGFTAFAAGSSDVRALVDADLVDADLPDVVLVHVALKDVAGLCAAGGLRADQLVEDSAAIAVAASTVEAAGSTPAEAGSTVVVEATAAATGN